MFRTYVKLCGDELVSTAVIVGQTVDPLHESQQVRFHHHIITLSASYSVSFLILDSLYNLN